MISSWLVGRVLSLKTIDVSPSSLADIFRGSSFSYCFRSAALQKERLKEPPLKMHAKDAGEKLRVFKLRIRQTSSEDIMYIDVGRERQNQFKERILA